MIKALKLLALPALILSLAAMWPVQSDAQRPGAGLNLNGRPVRGTHALRTGFTPDPWDFRLTAGGGRNPVDLATQNITGCSRGYVTARPDFRFNFGAGESFELLRFYVTSRADSLLLINEPNGNYKCNDDHGRSGWGESLMPAIDYNNPPAGRYDIWIGTYERQRNQPAVLHITELDSNHP